MAGSGELAPVAGEVPEGLPQQVHLSGLSKRETQLGSARGVYPIPTPEIHMIPAAVAQTTT